MGLDAQGVVNYVSNNPHGRVFVFDDWKSGQFFWKEFLAGMFIVVVMTGLDQDMMQKNLSCKNLRDAQKDMTCYGIAFLPMNILFLALGVLLYGYCAQSGITVAHACSRRLAVHARAGAVHDWHSGGSIFQRRFGAYGSYNEFLH